MARNSTMESLALAGNAVPGVTEPMSDGRLPLDVTRGPALFDAIPEPLLRAAPLLGAATREICREVLTMSDSAIDELIDAGVLEVQQTPA